MVLVGTQYHRHGKDGKEQAGRLSLAVEIERRVFQAGRWNGQRRFELGV